MRFCLEPFEWKSGEVAELAPITGCMQFFWVRSGSGRLGLATRNEGIEPHQLICLNSPCVLSVRKEMRGVRLELGWESVPGSSGDGVPNSFCQFLRWVCRNTVSISFPQGAHAEVEWLLDRVMREDRSRPELFWISVRLMLDGFFLLCYRQWALKEAEKEKVNALAKDVVKSMRDYIDVHYGEPIGLKRLSDHAGYSPSYLSSIFHKITGQCVVEYIIHRRIEHAKHLLASSRLKVVEVSLSSGFKDLAHFNRTFRRTVGATPSEYRRESRAERPRPVLVDLPTRPAGERPGPVKRGLRQFYVPVTADSAPRTTIAC